MTELNPVQNHDVEPEQEDGLEVEPEDETETRRPFDPEKIKIRTANPVVDQIVSRIDHGEIDLAPPFQRMAGIWDEQRKSRLIESLLLRIPIPVFYVAAEENETWSVVDGLQRTSTIYKYVKCDFNLSKLEYLYRLNGKSFEELPRPMQRRIRETQLVVNVIEPGTPEDVMFNIFRRINTGGMMLNGQEIRHALHPDPVRSFLADLAKTDEFITATRGSIRPNRMADRECVLRFLAFHINEWEKYDADDLDGFLSLSMKKINKMDDIERDRLSEDFKKSMQANHAIMGRNAFRKNRSSPISKALFEAWGVGLARRSVGEIESLVGNRSAVMEEFGKLMHDDSSFEKAITSSTSARNRIRRRFWAIEELIMRCL